MDPVALVRPRRRLAFPIVVVAYPLLYQIYGRVGIYRLARPSGDHLPSVLALTVAVVLGSYVLAIIVDVLLLSRVESPPRWAKPLVSPSTATLWTLGLLTVVVGVAIIAGPGGLSLPGWLAPVERTLGFVLAWPLFVAYLGTLATNPGFLYGTGLSPTDVLLSQAGLVLTAVWWFLLSAWIAPLVPWTASGSDTE